MALSSRARWPRSSRSGQFPTCGSQEPAALEGSGALLDSMEAGRWAECRRPLWLLVNQVKDFSPLRGHGAKGRGVPDTPLLSKRQGVPGCAIQWIEKG